jgi:hypothetical protein
MPVAPARYPSKLLGSRTNGIANYSDVFLRPAQPRPPARRLPMPPTPSSFIRAPCEANTIFPGSHNHTRHHSYGVRPIILTPLVPPSHAPPPSRPTTSARRLVWHRVAPSSTSVSNSHPRRSTPPECPPRYVSRTAFPIPLQSSSRPLHCLVSGSSSLVRAFLLICSHPSPPPRPARTSLSL